MVKTIEDAMLAIKSNEFLSEDLIRSIASSLIDYSSAKEEAKEPVNLDLFCQNITALETRENSRFDLPVANYKFNPKTNILILNKEYCDSEETNKENIGAQIMFDVLYNNGEITGFGIEGLNALNKGFREVMANNLAGNERINETPSDEYIYANLITAAFPESTNIFLEAYTQNKPINIVKFLKENNLENINRKAEYSNTSRNNSNGISLLDEIQKDLLEVKKEKSEEIIRTSVIKEMFENDLKHAGLKSFMDLYPANISNELIDNNEFSNIVPFPVSQENDKVLESLQKTM